MRKFALAFAATTMVAAPMAIPAPAFAQGTYQGSTWVGNDGRTYCRKKNGTVGIIVGGAGGALIGRAIAGRSRTTGTILGAAAGALLGREVARNRSVRHCR